MQVPNPLVVALTGERGSGKGLFAECFKELVPNKRIVSMKFQDPLREILTILNKPIARENYSALATALRTAFSDEGILVGAMKQRIQASDADIVILDGVRKAEEVPFIHEMSGILVYITADQKTRFERRSRNPEKADEFGMSWEAFLEQDNLPTELTIRSIGETLSDVTIDNSGSVEEFREKVKTFLRQQNFI